MKALRKKNKIILLPEILKGKSLRVKFCYFALRNLIYYTDKGLRTQMKSDKEIHNYNIKTIMDNYFKCISIYNTLSKEDSNLIEKCFTEKNHSIIPKNDYSLAVEKELKFNNFAFYCNCLVELSFHIDEDYFNDKYINDTILELSNKMLVKLNDNFIKFIIDDVNDIIALFSEI